MESKRQAYSDYDDSLSDDGSPTSTSDNVTIFRNSTSSVLTPAIRTNTCLARKKRPPPARVRRRGLRHEEKKIYA